MIDMQNTTASQSTTTSQGTTLETSVETVAEFRRSVVLVVAWMRDALDGLADDDRVEVVRENAGPFGRFVRSVTAV
jgi:hypothetical protein